MAEENETEDSDESPVDETTSEEKKTRQRLTVTAMQEAISDLVFTVRLKPDGQRGFGPCGFSYWKKPAVNQTVCQVHLMSDEALQDDQGATGDLVMWATADGGVEEVTAVLLDRMKTEFEEYRAQMLKSLDSVVEKHHGALRGARSKIREKKA